MASANTHLKNNLSQAVFNMPTEQWEKIKGKPAGKNIIEVPASDKGSNIPANVNAQPV